MIDIIKDKIIYLIAFYVKNILTPFCRREFKYCFVWKKITPDKSIKLTSTSVSEKSPFLCQERCTSLSTCFAFGFLVNLLLG